MGLWTFKSFLTDSGEHGRDVINEWYADLPPVAQAKFHTILEQLRDLPQHLWPPSCVKPLEQGILELRFKIRNVLHRPLGFFGPDRSEFTLLMPAREQGDEFVPRNALQIAIDRKDIVLADKGRAHECGL